MNTKDIIQVVKFEGVTPHEVYEALMDTEKHARFSGSPANINRAVGGESVAYDGWVEMVNVEIVPDEKIVQKWRGKSWKEGDSSIATFALRPVDGGTELTFTQTGVPEDTAEHIAKGWHEQYWDKMRKMFAK